MGEIRSEPLDLAIVIVNYKTCALLRDCLRSVYASRRDVPRPARGPDSPPLTFDVCMVDNASPDDSVEMVQREFPQVRVIANTDNAGYPQANNQGLRVLGYAVADQGGAFSGADPAAWPRYALLLNPDTVLPANALRDMVAFMDAHPQAGAAGPKLVRLDGSLDQACRRSFPTPTTSLYHMLKLDKFFPRSRRFGRYNLTYLDINTVSQVDAIVGAFMMVRREAIAQIGLLDETFWMYGEDLDWAKRIQAGGWQVWYNAAVTVTHVKEAASRHSYRARKEFYRALILFYEKHYRAETPFWLDWAIRGGVAVFGGLNLLAWRLRAARQGQPKPTAKAGAVP
jgi:N-acetylglucosaminyl-diphospho-decaprenol L-rhamnosyltransferase